MKKADEIKFELINWCKSGRWDICIPNFYYGDYEMDVFKLTYPSKLITEYEIKISRSDFEADIMKGDYQKAVGFLNGTCKPNRFYYVMPENLVSINSIPLYAGLIYFKDGRLTAIKGAKILHKQKPDDKIYQTLAQKLAFRCLIYERNYRFEKYRNNEHAKLLQDMTEMLKIKGEVA